MGSDRNHSLIFLTFILLLALALRLYRLDVQSLWNDEGTSVALAGRDLITITRGAAHDIHPPLYYYLLHFWTIPFGNSEFAIRSLSAMAGTLLVALTSVLGRRLFSTRVGLVAALLSAVSPFQVYYSQETRMYMLAALLGALSVYWALRMANGEWRVASCEWRMANCKLRMTHHVSRITHHASRITDHVSYVLVTTAALYTHYFTFTLVLAENLIALAWLATAGRWRKGRIMAWGVAQVAVGLLYLPWLAYTWRQLRQWPAVSEPFSLGFLLLDVFRVFSLGLPGERAVVLPLLAFGLVLLLGLMPLTLRSRLVTTLVYLLVPLAAMYFLSLRRPMYNPKFLLLATPPFYLLLARGVLVPVELETRFLRRKRVSIIVGLLLLALLIPSARSLHATYFDPRYYRDDYRGIVRTITATADEDDAVLINAPGQFETFAYYYQGDLGVYPLPRQRPIDVVAAQQDLEAIATDHDRVFAILWATDESDPDRFVEGWLDEHAFKARDTWYGNVRLVVYALPTRTGLAGTQHPLQINLGDQVTLLGYSLGGEDVVAGEVLPLTLVWQARTRMTERYKVFVQLLDGHDHIVGQRDAEPGGGVKLTTLWEPGEVVADNYGVPVAPGTPPGAHRLIVGMYSLTSGARLSVMGEGSTVADHVELATVKVTRPSIPPSPEALGMMHRRAADFGDVALLGYDLSKLGSEHEPDAPLHPGDPLHVTLYWQAGPAPIRDISLSLSLLGQGNRLWAARQTGPVDGEYPPALWEPGEVVRDQHLLFLPPDLPTGHYRLRLEVRAFNGPALGSPLDLGTITVQ